jgi:mannose-6-phosphate isomerase-like protein (cupin superfamily)
MNIFVDIDNTICLTDDAKGASKYEQSVPLPEKIAHINSLFDTGNRITYWTARGRSSGIDYTELTKAQLSQWNCKYHELKMDKPSYDLFIDDKTQHPNQLVLARTRKTSPEIVPKGWGHEVIFVNNDAYCGKILHFKKDAKFSMHYHLKKKETWYVASGQFLFKYIDTRTADIIEMVLAKGDTITNEIGEPHQIICSEEGDIFEVSTTHYDSDSYRVLKGDSQLHRCG